MAKIKLGTKPKNFKHTVTFPMLDGSVGQIEVTYKYRTRTEFGALVDEMAKAARESAEAAQKSLADDGISLEAIEQQGAAMNARYLMKVVEGWNLDEPFSEETAQQLADELPAAVAAIVDGYRTAITEGRLGN